MWYIETIKKYNDFEGRASRPEFWYFQITNILVFVCCIFADIFFDTYNWQSDRGVLEVCYLVFIFIPSLAVGVRRMHDIGLSGWCYLIPILREIIALFPSEEGENQYGLDPNDPYRFLSIRVMPSEVEYEIKVDISATIEMIVEELIDSELLEGSTQNYDVFLGEELLLFDKDVTSLSLKEDFLLTICSRQMTSGTAHQPSFDPFLFNKTNFSFVI